MFDSYSRRARLTPLFLVVIPIACFCFVVLPQLAAWYRLAPLAITAGILVLFDQLGRDRGRHLQPQLWAAWGGAPATAALRHRDNPNEALRARRHDQLKALMERDLPTRRQERQNPAKADQEYEASIVYLRAHTRSSEDFPLIFAENCHYGFRRSMLGLRPIGLGAAVTAAMGAGILFGLRGYGIVLISPLGLLVVLSISLAAVILWWRVVTPAWVKVPAEAYADRLLEAIETLTSNAR